MDVIERLKAILDERHQLGIAKYGHPVTPGDGHDWQNEALMELIDACQYLTARVIELEADE